MPVKRILPVKTGAPLRGQAAPPERGFEPDLSRVERQGWRSLGIGLVIAAVVLFFPFLRFIFSYLKTLVHELGHSVVDWLFGYPSIPAFDFIYGGGMAIHQERKTFLLVLIYAGFGFLFYLYRRNRLSLVILGIVVAVYTVFAFTPAHELLMLFMGHGTELIFAGIFLYRALSGSSIVAPVERPLYAFVGFFILLYDIGFAYQLITDYGYRVDYEEAKGGEIQSDFSRIADEFLHVNLTSVAGFFLVCCLVTPIFVFLFYRYRKTIFSGLAQIVRRAPEES